MSATEDHLTIGVLVRLVDQLYARLDRELAELRVAVEELDYATVKRGAFEELHTRFDETDRQLGVLKDSYSDHLIVLHKAKSLPPSLA